MSPPSSSRGAPEGRGPLGRRAARAARGRSGAPEAGGGARATGRADPPQPLEHRLLLTATLCLVAGGAVMVYSASSARTLLEGHGDGTGYLVKYLAFAAVGLLIMHALAQHSLAAVRRLTPVLLLGAFGLLVLTLIPGIGVEVNGARRWLGAGPATFQSAEIMKLALVLYAATVIARRPRSIRTLKGMLNPLILVAGAACVLIALQPDLGTALVIAFTMAALLVAAGASFRHLGTLAAGSGLAVLLFALIEPYRRARLTSFLDPWADAGGSGFQSVQGQIALGSGGFLGVGPGQSVQKIFYLPEAHTDFILAVIGEELGVVGICGLIFLYGIIAYAGLRTAKAASGAYAKLLAAGLTSLILCQAILNMFTVLGLAPLTGVPLPFISSGSTSLLMLLAAMGLLLNIASGGSTQLRAVDDLLDERDREPGRERDPRADRGGRDGGARRAGAVGSRRAAG
jgi:cell division protein FtsW